MTSVTSAGMPSCRNAVRRSMRDGFFLVEGSANASSNFRKCFSQTIFSLESLFAAVRAEHLP